MRRSQQPLLLGPSLIARIGEAASRVPESLREPFLLRVSRHCRLNTSAWQRRISGGVPAAVVEAAIVSARRELEVAP